MLLLGIFTVWAASLRSPGWATLWGLLTILCMIHEAADQVIAAISARNMQK
jgi:hypothetical protein